RADLAPFAQRSGARGNAVCPVKDEAFDGFAPRTRGGVPEPGDPARLDPVGQLRLHDRARAEGIAAVHRQRMIEDVEDAQHRRLPATTSLTARQPRARKAGRRPPGTWA